MYLPEGGLCEDQVSDKPASEAISSTIFGVSTRSSPWIDKYLPVGELIVTVRRHTATELHESRRRSRRRCPVHILPHGVQENDPTVHP